MKVLVVVVDAVGGIAVGSSNELAAEINFRESLTHTLVEAGVQVRRQDLSSLDLRCMAEKHVMTLAYFLHSCEEINGE